MVVLKDRTNFDNHVCAYFSPLIVLMPLLFVWGSLFLAHQIRKTEMICQTPETIIENYLFASRQSLPLHSQEHMSPDNTVIPILHPTRHVTPSAFLVK